MSSHIRALAARLGELDENTLATLLTARAVPPAARWTDTFDAAEWLLDAATLGQALAQLTRPELEALAAAAQRETPVPVSERAPLADLALIDAAGTPYGTVAEQALAWAAKETPISAPEPASAHGLDAAAERAFTSVAALGDILVETLATPLTRIGSGSVGAHDRRRLAEDAVPIATDIDALVALAVEAELLALIERNWLVTQRGSQWLRLPTLERWVVVARAWRAALPGGIHVETDARTWTDEYPADVTWPPIAAALRAQAEAWGLVTDDGAETAWAALLWAGGADAADGADAAAAASAALGALLPSEVDSVYLQNDLTAIAPGPLAPSLDLRLRTMARRESHAQASTYRFTAETIAAAVTAGETAESIRAFLESLSRTGVPQPLDYLITSAAGRHGMVRVQALPVPAREPGGAALRTLITSNDPALLDTLLVDQSLQVLSLTRSRPRDSNGEPATEHSGEPGLESRAARDVVYWSLIDARYPAAALDEDGIAEPLHRNKIAADPAPVLPPLEVYRTLVTALLADVNQGDDEAWLARDLEVAVRGRETVTLVVSLPGGEHREFTMELTGIGGGRVRGRDKKADLERTLPLSSIAAVRRG